MLADLPQIASELREDTFAGAVARDREKIQLQLRETGTYTVQEGGRRFTISVPRPQETEPPTHTPR